MSKKLGNKELFIILVVLIGIYGIYRMVTMKKGENTFKPAIIPKLDSSKVNGMLIYTNAKKGEPMRFTLKDNKWYVNQGGYTTLADEKAEGYAFEQIKQITPDRLATADPAQWKDYNVMDTMGTRLVLLNNNDTLLDLIVGRFGFNPQLRQGISYVRLHGQKEVYGVIGFLAMNITQEVESWRDRKIFNQSGAMWNKVIFTYPGDSSFSVQKDPAGTWRFENGDRSDSAATIGALNTLSQQNYGSFVPKFDTNSTKPQYSLKIEGGNTVGSFIINAYPADTANGFVVTSTFDPGSYFSGKKNGLFDRVFLSKKAFLHHDAPRQPAAPSKLVKK